MKEISKEVLRDAANRLMFEMSDGEYDTLLKEFEVINKQMKTIGEIEGLDEVEPMTFPFECHNDILRDDEPADVLSPEEALSNAGSKMDGQIKLPKVVG